MNNLKILILIVLILICSSLNCFGSVNYNQTFTKKVDIWDHSEINDELLKINKDINYLKRLTYNTVVMVKYMDTYLEQFDENNNGIKTLHKRKLTMSVLEQIFILLIPIILFFIGIIIYRAYMTIEYVDCVKVIKTERINKRNSSKYMIFTEDEVFENTDTIFHMKFNSSDIYGKLKQSNVYSFKVNGWRIPFLSKYRNILLIREY